MDAASFPFEFSVIGRVSNISLPPSYNNSLLPVFEAVQNGVHAVIERFGKDNLEHGQIIISVYRNEDGDPVSFSIRDNGAGMHDENFRSFRTSDSRRKRELGGKGVGRLSWLKAFQAANIESVFYDKDQPIRRKFRFVYAEEPIQQHQVEKFDDVETYTDVNLEQFHDNFRSYCPKKMDTIVNKTIGHFLHYLLSAKAPEILIIDGDEEVNVRKFLYDSVTNEESLTLCPLVLKDEADGDNFIRVTQFLVHKSQQFQEGGKHWQFFGANDRVVLHEKLDTPLGLKFVGENQDYVYISYVDGEIFDHNVNQERTNFSISEETMEEIRRTCISCAKAYLFEEILDIKNKQQELSKEIIRKNPQFLPFQKTLNEFVEALPLNTGGEEEIFLELSRRRFRNRRKREAEFRANTDKTSKEKLAEIYEKYKNFINDEKRSFLAEYVTKRRSIIDLIDRRTGFLESQEGKHYDENLLHEIICPLGKTSDDLDYDQHNLWLIDDRLAFVSYFASDKRINTQVSPSDSLKEPDLTAFYESSLAFRRKGETEPVVLVEFKKPGRDDYTGNDNPVKQVIDYVSLFRDSNKKVKDKEGRVVNTINSSTRFICYIIADMMPTLENVLRYTPIQHHTPDGVGRFGTMMYEPTYIEIIPYEKLINDAKLRNEIFFRKLGIEDI